MPLRKIAEQKKTTPESESEQLASDDHLGVVAENTEDLQTALSLGYKQTSWGKMELAAAVQLTAQELGERRTSEDRWNARYAFTRCGVR
jgi:hypothetical protein